MVLCSQQTTTFTRISGNYVTKTVIETFLLLFVCSVIFSVSHSTLTMPLSAQEYKLDNPVCFMNAAKTQISSSCYGPLIKAGS